MKKHLLIGVSLAAVAATLSAQVVLPPVYSDHAVFQRQKKVAIRGTAKPGSPVKVTFAGQTKNTTAAANGEWLVKLDPMEASAKGETLTVSDADGSVTRQDILVGEVFLCGGQSNMQCPLWGKNPRFRHHTKTEDGLQVAKQSANPLIRIYNVPRGKSSPEPTDPFPGLKWLPVNEKSVQDFSAVGYFFGKYLFDSLKVPVGLIGSNWGGSSIEAYTSPEGFAAIPELKKLSDEVAAKQPGTPAYEAGKRALADTLQKYLEKLEEAYQAKKPLPHLPQFPVQSLPYTDHQRPAMKYNTMIWPLRNYTLRGAIWYQGESNINDGMNYYYKQKALIESWKRCFDNPELKFYFVQLAPFRHYAYGALPTMWCVQEKFARDFAPDVGMAVINDVGDLNDIHPGDKRTVGRRLANLVLERDFGVKGLKAEMPIFDTVKFADGKAVLSFKNVEKWQALPGGVKHFEIASADSLFVPATVKIDGANLIVSAQDVKNPRQVRYLWQPLTEASIVNEAGLPLGCFCTPPPEREAHLAAFDREWQLLCSAELCTRIGDGDFPYTIDNRDKVKGKAVRVAYVLETVAKNGEKHYLTVQLEALDENPAKHAIPTKKSGIFFNKTTGPIFITTDLGSDVITRKITDKGVVEFWPWTYNIVSSKNLPLNNPKKYDFDDRPTQDGLYGSMQIHNIRGGTIFAYNAFRPGAIADFGMGNNPDPKGHPDWTFSKNTRNFQSIILKIYVKTK